MRTGSAEASKERMARTPPRPACSDSRKGASPRPIGVTRPIPVTTTRRAEDMAHSSGAWDAAPRPSRPGVGARLLHQLFAERPPAQLVLADPQPGQRGLVALADEQILVEDPQVLDLAHAP